MKKLVSILGLCSVIGLLAACGAHQPLDERPPAPAGEFEEGPGLFSGADGGFYLVGNSDKKRTY